MEVAGTQQKTPYQRVAEWFHVPPSARKVWAGGMGNLAASAVRVLNSVGPIPRAVKVALTGVLMGVIGVKSSLEGETGDRMLGVFQDEVAGRTQFEPTGFADAVTLGNRLTRKGGAQLLVSQLLQMLNNGAQMVSNLPQLSTPSAERVVWASKWIFGPLIAIAETAQPLFVRASAKPQQNSAPLPAAHPAPAG